MITLHLSNFKALQASKAWKRFCFLSENQPSSDHLRPLKASLTFTSMTVFVDPTIPTIAFMEAGNRVWLDFVAAVDCEPDVLGDLIKVTCRGGEEYIIVAQD